MGQVINREEMPFDCQGSALFRYEQGIEVLRGSRHEKELMWDIMQMQNNLWNYYGERT
jgi:hypothetical protein